jgi:outer membrane protein, multidrug efflux system
MQSLRLVAAAILLSPLAACTLPRPPASVAPAVPPRWYAPLPHGGTLADLRHWWQQFHDPLLLRLIDAAEAVSPDVATAGRRIAEARSTRIAARAALLPGVDANASVVRGNAQLGVPLSTITQAGLQTSWEIDLFGGRHAQADAAAARLRGAQAGWDDARVAIAAETASAYVDLRTCERQLAVTRNDARSRAETARLTGLSADAGFTAPAVAAQARASAAEGAARATQQQAQCDLFVKGLVAVTGIAEPALRSQLAAPWAEPDGVAAATLPAVPAALLLQRPDVYAAERAVEAASADVGAARADRYPRLSLTGQVGLAWFHAAGRTVDADTWQIGPVALTMPVFDAGRRAAAEDASRARYDEAVVQYEARVRQAVREVEEALVNLESARQRNADARIAVEGYRISFDATESRYRSGLGSLIELEDQRRVLLAAETTLVSLQRERLAAWIALYRALGGGWQPADDAQAAAAAADTDTRNPPR